MNEIGVGLLGFGTVGAGVVEGLQQNINMMTQRLGVRPVLRRIADLDIERDRGVTVASEVLTTDAAAVIDDPQVDIVVELIGGTGIARELVKQALACGKPVVTANKKLLAEYGTELYALAEKQRTDLYFGASVGGAIPIIRALREGLSANCVQNIYGILNGTCNYILTQMESVGMTFETALQEAQEQGFAEADPSLDIDGYDTAHKAAILASLAYGSPVALDAVSVEGIRGLAPMDLEFASRFGYRIKLLAVIKRDGAAMEVRVHPTLVPMQHMLASVDGVFNAVMVDSDLADRTLYYGRGAGRLPTASTVLGDIADVARNLAVGASHRLPAVPRTGETLNVKPMDDIRSRYYLRMMPMDRPGVLAQFAGILGEHNISIESVLQQGESVDAHVPLVIITHQAVESELVGAIQEIEALGEMPTKTVCLRIET